MIEKKKYLTIAFVKSEVAKHLETTEERIDKCSRRREIVQDRQMTMYLCTLHTKAPLSKIGAKIGKKDHATVIHAKKVSMNLIDTDKDFREDFNYINNILKRRRELSDIDYHSSDLKDDYVELKNMIPDILTNVIKRILKRENSNKSLTACCL